MNETIKTYKRIEKYASEADISGYDMRNCEMAAILTCSSDAFRIMDIAFRFGFDKGCRKTKKMMNT